MLIILDKEIFYLLGREETMTLQISDKTLKQTTKCPFSFQFLNKETRSIYIIDRCFEGDVCFLETAKPQVCPYKISFGYSYMCHCPVR
jgi:hypothetical protein